MPQNNSAKSKVAIVGCGRVGMSIAFSILHKNQVDQLVLHGRDKAKIIGEQLDLEHGASFLGNTQILATDQDRDLAESQVVIISAGKSQCPGDTRLDLVKQNSAILENLLPRILRYAPQAVIIVVTNPVDVLTYRAYRMANLPKGQIFGSGTTLDTSRFRFHLSEFLKINPRSIHAYILGEHGDSAFPTLSSATVGGQSLVSLPRFSMEKALEAFEKSKQAAYKIIESKGATYYAIGAVVAHITTLVLRNARSVLPVSIPLHNYYGQNGVALSVPCIIGRNGVEETLEIKLSWEEKQMLAKSAETLKKFYF